MCDLIENLCTFWDRMLDASKVTVDTPILTSCFASPRHGEEGWRAYDAQQLDPARVTPLNPEECRAFAEEARSRGHWEIAKIIALSVGTVLATVVLYIGLCLLVTAVMVGTIIIFANLAVAALAVSELLTAAIGIVGLLAVAAEVCNGIPAILYILTCTWTKEGIPQISRSYDYMQHLYERSRELEILGARDPEPAAALAVGGA